MTRMLVVLETTLPFVRRLLPFVVIFLTSVNAFAANGSISLAWDRSTETDVVGYKVYWGTSSRLYTAQQDNQNEITATISNLEVGSRYYFAVTAYNQSGLESAYSQEVSGIVGSPPIPTPSPTATPPPEGTPSPTPFATPSATPTPTPPPQYLANLSTRGNVANADEVLIGGFIISGDTNKLVVIRGIGPSLAQFGVAQLLADPTLELFDAAGNMVDENDNWTSLPPGTVPANLQPSNPAESAISRSLAPGAYTAVLRGVDGSAGNALIELYDLEPGNSRVLNMSTRGLVGTNDAVVIAGFTVSGTEPSRLLLRAIGPSLIADGIEGALADPVMELHDSDGSLIYQNDNWRSGQEQAIIDTAAAPSDARESAIVATLQPGAYTAIVRGANNSAGIALVEVYAIDN